MRGSVGSVVGICLEKGCNMNNVIEVRQLSHLPRGGYLRMFTDCSVDEAVEAFQRTENRQPEFVYRYVPQTRQRGDNENAVKIFIR